MKKVLSLFLSVLMLTSVVAAVDLSAYATTYYTSGDYEYTILDDGTAEITDYNGSASSLTIPSTLDGYVVTSLGEYAFNRCTSLTSLIIGNSVKSIGDYAFQYCTSLTSITIPDSVTNIGYMAFGCCESLTSITIPDSVTSIEKYAFYECTSLTSITIPDSVTSIGEWAFEYCTSLTSITIPGSVTSISCTAFTDCDNLTDIYYGGTDDEWKSIKSTNGYNRNLCFLEVVVHFSDGTTGEATINGTCGDNLVWELENGTLTISGSGKMSYYYDGYTDEESPSAPWRYLTKSMKYIIIDDGVTSVAGYAFEGCTSLTSVTIGNDVTSIGSGTFYKCTSLTSITIPDSVTSIGWDAFYKCDSLTDVYYGGSENDWIKIDIDDYNECLTNATIHYNSTVDAAEESRKAETEEETSGSTSSSSSTSTTTECTTHTWDSGKTTTKATCTKTGVKTYTCTVCGATKTETIAKTAHTYKNVVTKATTSKNGKITPTCSVCGKTKTATTIYKPKSMSLSTTSYTYNGKAKKPSVTVKDSKGNKISSKYYTVSYISQSTGKKVSSMKNPGKYYVKVTFKTRYSGSLKKAVTIKPKKTSIKSIKASSKGFTVKWGKVSTQNTGYQIQYSTSKSFKSPKTVTVKKTGTTSKKVTKLKAKKKYYVRVRTYKTVKVNGKSTKIYSAWSSVKGVTTKK